MSARIVNVSGFGPVSIERDTIASSSDVFIAAPPAFAYAVIRSGSAARPWPSSVAHTKHGSPGLPGLIEQSIAPWPVGELSPPADCRCMTTIGVANCSCIVRSSAPGASVEANGLSSPLSVPCSPKITSAPIGVSSVPSTRTRNMWLSLTLPPGSASFSPRRSWLTRFVGSKLPSNDTPSLAGRCAASASRAVASNASSMRV